MPVDRGALAATPANGAEDLDALDPGLVHRDVESYTWQRLPIFFQKLTEYGNVTRAARDAGDLNLSFLYRLRREHPKIREIWSEAARVGALALEDEARRRAFEGWDKPVGWYQGEPGGTVREYSDTLLIFLLKAHFPEKYRERYEVSGPGGGPLQVASQAANSLVQHLTTEELEMFNDLMDRAARRAEAAAGAVTIDQEASRDG